MPKKPGVKSLHVCRHERRKQRRAEAIERQERRDKRSLSHHLALLDARPGNSTKERNRINGS